VATPILCRPIEFGADIVVHSLTKWLGGHGTGIGGIMVDSGKYDWKGDKFPLMNDPEPSYHGVRWAHDLPDFLAPVAFAIRMRVIPLRNLGACIAPDNSWLFLQGIETLPLRMQQHDLNGRAVAAWLLERLGEERVIYPGLAHHPHHELAKRQMSGFGGMMTLDLKTIDNARAFLERVRVFSLAESLGGGGELDEPPLHHDTRVCPGGYQECHGAERRHGPPVLRH
jgi:O-acetylhomoserine (thiol)-lyase